MNILIRVDGSKKLGFGHISRMLNLIEVLKNHKITVILGKNNETSKLFSEKNIAYKTTDTNEKQETKNIINMAKTADLIIVDRINDNYSNSYFDNIRTAQIPIIAIDDCGNKKINADIIINGTIVKKWQKYPSTGKYFIGPEYMLLNKEFSEYKKVKKIMSEKIETVTITTGGSDMKSISPKIAKYLSTRKEIKHINVIQGPYFSENTKNQLQKIGANKKINIIKKCKDLSEIISLSDLVILTAGITAYECACIGTPFIAINQVSHQNYTSSEFEKQGVCIDLEKFNNHTIKKLDTELNKLTKDRRENMSNCGKQLVDGNGVFRVRDIIENINN